MKLCNLPSTLLALAGCLLLSMVNADQECVKGVAVPEGGDYSNWPDLFRLTTPNPEDPTLSNMDDTVGPVDPSVLVAAGVGYLYLDPSGYTYPNRTKEIPWSPPANGTNDPNLQDIRDEYDYQYADIVVVGAYNEKFYEEHIHAGGDEVRYVIDGSGYFDIRDVNDEWVRMHATAGAFIIFPSGIEHRFAVDENLYIQAMRLFPGSGDPDWSSVPRAETHGNNTARNEYIDTYLCGIDPDMDHHSEDSHDGEEEDHSEEEVIDVDSEDDYLMANETSTGEMVDSPVADTMSDAGAANEADDSSANSFGSFAMVAMAMVAGVASLMW